MNQDQAVASPVGKLNELFNPPRWGSFEFPGAIEVNSGSPDKPRWRSTIQVLINDDEKRVRVYKGSNEWPDKTKARADAANVALQDEELLRKVASLKASMPASLQPKRPQNLIEAFHMHCVKSKLSISESFASTSAGTYNCTITIKSAAGVNTYQSSAVFGSKDAAKQDAVQVALKDLVRGDPSASQLLALLPKGELTGSRDEATSFSSSLFSPQQRGKPFVTKEGIPLKEGRALEFKALNPGTEKDTPDDLNRIIERYLRQPVECNGKPLGFYLSAFLNSRINGSLVFGVRDDGTVWGLPVTTKGEDEFLLAFDEMLRRFYPVLSLDKGLIKKPVFIPVIAERAVKDLKIIIIEVNAPPLSQGDVIFFWDTRMLPSIKWEASATPMTPEELLRKCRP